MTNAVTTASQVAELTSIGQNIILALCGVFTVWIAYCGLTTWRKELKGKSEYAKAKEVLKAVYKVRQAFMIVRSPGIYPYEYPEKMRDDTGQLKSGCDYEATMYVYQERWKFMYDAFKELEDQTLDAQVEWGPEFQNLIVPLRKCRGELQMAIQDLLRGLKDPNERHERQRRSAEEKREERHVLYYVGENFDGDKFTPEINTAISEFEKILRPHIKK